MNTNARKPNNAKLYIAGGFLLVLAGIVFAQQAFNLDVIPHSRPGQIYLLYTLSTLIFAVPLVFGSSSSDLIKVWIERKAGGHDSRPALF
jgi:hypothetical protein